MAKKYTCEIPTFIGARSADKIYGQGEAVGTARMEQEQRQTRNPDLGKCGSMPGCRDCGLPEITTETCFGDAVAGVVRRTAARSKTRLGI